MGSGELLRDQVKIPTDLLQHPHVPTGRY